MTTEITQQASTPEIFKSKIQIALTKAEISIQALHDAESELVYNEDNLESIALFLKNAKAAKKLVDDERKKLKEPSLQEGRAIDAGAKLVDVELDAVIAKANVPYQKLCQEVERKRKEAEVEAERVRVIREAMDSFKIDYSVKISDAKTNQELIAIERMINLETANSRKYMEFLPEMKTLCEPIRSLLAAQKVKVKELAELELQASQAAENGSDEKVLEIMEKKEVLEAEIAQKRIDVQETAANQAQNSPSTATVILPLIPKGGRKLWRYEITDEKAAAKAGLMKLVPDTEKIDAILKDKRDGEATDVTENGVRYFIQKTF